MADIKEHPDWLRVTSLLDKLPTDWRVSLLDVGSIGGLKGRWAAYDGRVDSIGFDPREDGDEPTINGCHTVYPEAVGACNGKTTLYVTQFGNMSSILKPNAKELAKHRGWGPAGRVIAEEELDIRTIDSLLDQKNVDAIKVDTQGSELEILRGAEKLLESVILAELETSFFERYEGQPLFADIAIYMRERGFELLDLVAQQRWYRESPQTLEFNYLHGLGHTGRIAYADAIFFVNDEKLTEIIEQTPENNRSKKVASALLLLILYGKLDFADALMVEHGHYLPFDEQAVFLEFLASYVKSK